MIAKELEGKVAAVTGGASGIGLASAEAMLAAGARVVLVDRDEAALRALREKHGDSVVPLVIDLLDAKSCATLMPQILEKAGQLDILHANAGIYVGGDLVDAKTDAIDRMLNLWRLLARALCLGHAATSIGLRAPRQPFRLRGCRLCAFVCEGS
jgi:ribitol 2-dehydrogenase